MSSTGFSCIIFMPIFPTPKSQIAYYSIFLYTKQFLLERILCHALCTLFQIRYVTVLPKTRPPGRTAILITYLPYCLLFYFFILLYLGIVMAEGFIRIKIIIHSFIHPSIHSFIHSFIHNSMIILCFLVWWPGVWFP